MEKFAYNKYICFYHLKSCYSSQYITSFYNIFKEDNTCDEMFQFKTKINVPNSQIICSSINSNKNYVFFQPYNKKGFYLIN